MSRHPDDQREVRRRNFDDLNQRVAARARLRLNSEVSAGYLGLGFAVLGGLLLVRGLISLAWSWSAAPSRELSILAWVGLLVTFAGAVVIARRSGGIMPARFSRIVIIVSPAAIIVDFAAFSTGGAATPYYPTAVIGASACVFACLPLQTLRSSVEGFIMLAVSSVATVFAGGLLDSSSLSAGVTGTLLGLTPVAAGIWMISATDRHVDRTIDRAVTESLITAPAQGYSVEAVSKLRRLDRDAEHLLETVSQLPLNIPIDEATSSSARELSDGLRLALVFDHKQTWLQIALNESDHLGRTVRVIDPASLAARLEPEERRLLLALTWLAVASASRPVLDITFMAGRGDRASSRSFTVELSLTGTHRRGIDPAIWPLLSRLGRHTISVGADRALITAELGESTAERVGR